jgi:hypothetical protein
MKITIADIEAIYDVMDAVADAADTMTVEEAIAFSEALDGIKSRMLLARSLCETQVKHKLDGQPIKIDNTLFVEKDTGKWRPNQSMIRSRVVGMAACDIETGELLEARSAASRAVDFMYDLFVSPSEMPKVGGLKKLGLKTNEVADWEKTGSEITKIVLKASHE